MPYSYIYDTHYFDQNGKNWSVIKEDEDYVFPTGYTENNSEAIAKNVGYNGILLRTYIWMEGTDADCVNNSATEDEATYSVTLRLAGIASNGNQICFWKGHGSQAMAFFYPNIPLLSTIQNLLHVFSVHLIGARSTAPMSVMKAMV